MSVAFFLPDDRITRIRSLPQEQPRFVLFDNRPQRVVIVTSAAWEPFEGFSIGAGLNYLTNTGGTVHIDGTLNVANPGKPFFWAASMSLLNRFAIPPLRFIGDRSSLVFQE